MAENPTHDGPAEPSIPGSWPGGEAESIRAVAAAEVAAERAAQLGRLDRWTRQDLELLAEWTRVGNAAGPDDFARALGGLLAASQMLLRRFGLDARDAE